MNEVKGNLNQLKLLLWKNYALQKRSIIGLILELSLPAFFAIILLPIRGIVKSTDHANNTVYDPYLVDLFPPNFYPDNVPFAFYNKTSHLWDYSKVTSKWWCLGYSPANDTLVNKIMNNIYDQWGFTMNAFDIEDEMVAFVTDGRNNHDCLGGVSFLNTSTSNFTYKIRLSYSPRNSRENGVLKQDYDWKTNLLYSLFPVLGPRDKGQPEGGDPGYYREGFLFLQKQIDTYLISEFSSNVSSLLVNLERFPYPPYHDDNFVLVIQALFPFIIMLSFVFTVIFTAKAITYEKEAGIKEAMKLMGLKPWIYWLSWYIKTMILIAPAVIFMVISFKVKINLKGGGHAAILNETNPLILALFFFLYLTSSITFTFLTTSFFKKANSAAAGSGIIWFLSYLPYIFISLRYQKMTLFDKIAACFVNNLGMSEAVQLIGMFEGKGVGVQWSNINEGVSVDDNFTFLEVLIILLLNNVVHLVLLYYFEQINPGDHGIARPWYFPVYFLFPKLDEKQALDNLRNSRNGIVRNDEEDATNKIFIENEAPYASRKVGIQIRGLSKIFKQFGVYKQAVNDLSLNMYDNHITVLLGHNGAGKSTTISMITGICKPTAGHILVDNHDIITETKQARAQLGYCPQHNLLFNDLTVYEHLMFFSKLKNSFDEAEILTMLESLNLSEKSHSLAKTLSGGQKRKLCVAIAFIGQSKIVILDEPTSGMDPQARHGIWTLLQKFKKEKDCSILLTTHFMDEADCLGDRIAIMSRGELRCCGSPLYLKSMYGSGYNLILTRKSLLNSSSTANNQGTEVDYTAQLTALVNRHVANAKLNSEISSEISFILPKEESAKFPQLLLDLETQKDALNIVNIGISITTVEDVFLKIGELENVDESDLKLGHSAVNAAMTDDNHDKVRVHLIQDGENGLAIDDNSGLWIGAASGDRVSNLFLFYWRQFMALFIKRAIHSFRNKFLGISQIIVPFATLIIVLVYIQFGPIKAEDSPPLALNLAKYRQNFVPFLVRDNSATNDSFVSVLGNYFEREFNTINNAKVFNLDDNKTVSLCAGNRSDINAFLVCVAQYSLTFINDNYVVGTTFEQNKDDEVTIIGHFNNQPYHVPPLALNLISNTLLKFYSNQSSSRVNIINHPLPRNVKDKISDLKLKDSTGFNVATDLTFGFAFLISSFVVFLVKERVSGSKHVQYLSGVNIPIFWLSALAWDFFNFLIPTAVSIGIIWAFGIKQFIDGGRVLIVIGLFVLYGLAHIPQAYLMSYMFTVPATGFAVTVAWNILSSQATLTAVGILQLPMLELQDIAGKLEWAFLILFPNFGFGQAMTDLYANYEAVQVCEQLVPLCKQGVPNPCCYGFNNIKPSPCYPGDCFEWTSDFMAWRRPGLLRFFVFLPLQFIIQFGLVLLYETGFLRMAFYEIKSLLSEQEDVPLESNYSRLEMERLYGDMPKDEDVISEEQRIYELNPTSSDELLIIENLTKYYGNFMAVKGISMGIKSGETFGLLGVNGAGKTSTFKMLTGDETITNGNAYLNKMSIKTNIKMFQQQLGYCPQFDPLIDQMTTMETLVMFARLRGIREPLINPLSYSLITLLDLQDHVDKMCMTLSGGNKRKLSVAISLIGSPAIILLDEPTSGMDPKTRRFLWNCLNKIRNRGKSLILTSHSMDETEALCTRLGIMVNGELKCLGSLQHIKSRYGEGYTLLVKLTAEKITPESVQEFIDYILRTFENTILKECRDGFVNIHFNDNSIRMLANIFSLIESVKVKYEIEYYIVTQTKLEQIFLNFASKQIDPQTRYLQSSGCFLNLKCC